MPLDASRHIAFVTKGTCRSILSEEAEIHRCAIEPDNEDE